MQKQMIREPCQEWFISRSKLGKAFLCSLLVREGQPGSEQVCLHVVKFARVETIFGMNLRRQSKGSINLHQREPCGRKSDPGLKSRDFVKTH
jgi:hypothetical protein